MEDTRAIFARYLRKAYGFRDQGEHRIDILFNILCEKFAELRRNRDNISRTETFLFIFDFIISAKAI